MITAAPLPAWGDFLAILDADVPADARLTAPWAIGGGRGYPLSRSAWSLSALVEMRKIEGQARPRLWLPDFFCNTSSGPARAAGADVVFYPVTQAMTPDWAACRALAERARPSLFVLVHYFGAANDTEGAKTFCVETGAALVEDAAHVLGPTSKIGRAGDYVLFSPHKLIGIPDGAILVARKGTEALNRALKALPAAQPSPWGWMARRVAQMAIPEVVWKIIRPIPDIPFEYDPPAATLFPYPGMSATARKILGRAFMRLDAEAESRREAETALRTALSGIPGWKFWPIVWGNDESPYRAVFVCDTPAMAAERFSRLRRAGCLVESWPDMASEVVTDPTGHGEAIDLRRRILVFPLPPKEKAEALARACVAALR